MKIINMDGVFLFEDDSKSFRETLEEAIKKGMDFFKTDLRELNLWRAKRCPGLAWDMDLFRNELS